MTEETLDPEEHTPHWFETWTTAAFENCGCECSYDDPYLPEGSGPHNLWRHPIALPLITFSLGFGLAPEGWSVTVKDAWREGHITWAIAQAVLFFGLWLLSGVGLLFFTILYALTEPLRWIWRRSRKKGVERTT